jgi:hypothetical protein
MGFVDLNGGGAGPSRGAGFGVVPKPLVRYLDTNGNGSGLNNAIGDYSVTPDIFYIQPASTEIFRITRMLVLIRSKATSFLTDRYGSVPELSNGLIVRTQNDGGTIVDLTDGLAITTNGCWGRLAFDAEIYDSSAGADTFLRVRWTFEKMGYPIRLDGSQNERLEVVLNDDFTDGASSNALANHFFVAQGYYEKE